MNNFTDTDNLEFQEAFNQACDEQMPDNAETSEQEVEEEIPETDQDTNSEPESEPEDSQVNTEPEPEPDKSQYSEPDYKSLYFELKRVSDAQLSRVHAHLQDLSAQYQELKQQQEMKSQAKPEELPSHIKEVFEAYPEIADAVQYLVDSKVNKTQQQLQSVVDSKIKPLQNQLYLTEAQKHEAIIRAAHPDITEILMSGDLQMWINSLPPVMRTGASRIYESGTADEIVAMLNEYKQARGIPNGTRKSSSAGIQESPGYSRTSGRAESVLSPSEGRSSDTSGIRTGGTGRGQGDGEEDEIVKKVLAAMAVASKREPLDVPKKRRRTPQQDFMAIAKQYENSMGRRLPY